jgi:hypothetical protein
MKYAKQIHIQGANKMIRNNRKFRLASLLLLVPTAGVMALPSVASAAVRQVLPGTICQLHGQALTDTSIAGQESLSYSQYGSVINNHPTKYLHVVCPITRFSNYRATIRIYFTVKGFLNPLKCQINSNYWIGANPYSNTQEYQALQAVYASQQVSRFWVHNVPQLNNEYGITNYTVFCKIPPRNGALRASRGKM